MQKNRHVLGLLLTKYKILKSLKITEYYFFADTDEVKKNYSVYCIRFCR